MMSAKDRNFPFQTTGNLYNPLCELRVNSFVTFAFKRAKHQVHSGWCKNSHENAPNHYLC